MANSSAQPAYFGGNSTIIILSPHESFIPATKVVKMGMAGSEMMETKASMLL
jgi:hypothetical protein